MRVHGKKQLVIQVLFWSEHFFVENENKGGSEFLRYININLALLARRLLLNKTNSRRIKPSLEVLRLNEIRPRCS